MLEHEIVQSFDSFLKMFVPESQVVNSLNSDRRAELKFFVVISAILHRGGWDRRPTNVGKDATAQRGRTLPSPEPGVRGGVGRP